MNLGKKARRTASITNIPTCGGDAKSGLAPSVGGAYSLASAGPSMRRAINTSSWPVNCQAAIGAGYPLQHNPACSGGVGDRARNTPCNPSGGSRSYSSTAPPTTGHLFTLGTTAVSVDAHILQVAGLNSLIAGTVGDKDGTKFFGDGSGISGVTAAKAVVQSAATDGTEYTLVMSDIDASGAQLVGAAGLKFEPGSATLYGVSKVLDANGGSAIHGATGPTGPSGDITASSYAYGSLVTPPASTSALIHLPTAGQIAIKSTASGAAYIAAGDTIPSDSLVVISAFASDGADVAAMMNYLNAVKSPTSKGALVIIGSVEANGTLVEQRVELNITAVAASDVQGQNLPGDAATHWKAGSGTGEAFAFTLTCDVITQPPNDGVGSGPYKVNVVTSGVQGPIGPTGATGAVGATGATGPSNGWTQVGATGQQVDYLCSLADRVAIGTLAQTYPESALLVAGTYGASPTQIGVHAGANVQGGGAYSDAGLNLCFEPGSGTGGAYGKGSVGFWSSASSTDPVAAIEVNRTTAQGYGLRLEINNNSAITSDPSGNVAVGAAASGFPAVDPPVLYACVPAAATGDVAAAFMTEKTAAPAGLSLAAKNGGNPMHLRSGYSDGSGVEQPGEILSLNPAAAGATFPLVFGGQLYMAGSSAGAPGRGVYIDPVGNVGLGKGGSLGATDLPSATLEYPLVVQGGTGAQGVPTDLSGTAIFKGSGDGIAAAIALESGGGSGTSYGGLYLRTASLHDGHASITAAPPSVLPWPPKPLVLNGILGLGTASTTLFDATNLPMVVDASGVATLGSADPATWEVGSRVNKVQSQLTVTNTSATQTTALLMSKSTGSSASLEIMTPPSGNASAPASTLRLASGFTTTTAGGSTTTYVKNTALVGAFDASTDGVADLNVSGMVFRETGDIIAGNYNSKQLKLGIGDPSPSGLGDTAGLLTDGRLPCSLVVRGNAGEAPAEFRNGAATEPGAAIARTLVTSNGSIAFDNRLHLRAGYKDGSNNAIAAALLAYDATTAAHVPQSLKLGGDGATTAIEVTPAGRLLIGAPNSPDPPSSVNPPYNYPLVVQSHVGVVGNAAAIFQGKEFTDTVTNGQPGQIAMQTLDTRTNGLGNINLQVAAPYGEFPANIVCWGGTYNDTKKRWPALSVNTVLQVNPACSDGGVASGTSATTAGLANVTLSQKSFIAFNRDASGNPASGSWGIAENTLGGWQVMDASSPDAAVPALGIFGGIGGPLSFYCPGSRPGSTDGIIAGAVVSMDIDKGKSLRNANILNVTAWGSGYQGADPTANWKGSVLHLGGPDMAVNSTMYFITSESSGGPKFAVRGDGLVQAAGDVVGNTTVSSSDARTKENDTLIVDALPTLEKLKPKTYSKKLVLDLADVNRADCPSATESGFVAQEVWRDAEELRHLIRKDPEASPEYADDGTPVLDSWGDTLAGISYVQLVPWLVKAVQELSEEVRNLRAEINGHHPPQTAP
jgi:hypothetical protein